MHPSASSSGSGTAVEATPERIRSLSLDLQHRIGRCSQEIAEINLQTRILSMNAQIEAARAGEAGRSFSHVGREMVTLAARTAETARQLEVQTQGVVGELAAISGQLARSVRGRRLADLALTNIDLIDRNLYERSCDCRWWATDSAAVEALQNPEPEVLAHASDRLGVILKAYTVYFDIVLADRNGVILANGRPQTYPSRGTVHGDAPWFRSAWATKSGDEFGFQTAHASPLAGGERVLVYSCKVCAGGAATGEPLGVLGVVFRWDALADQIVRATPVDASEKDCTRACIVDDDGFLLADSGGETLQGRLEFAGRRELFAKAKDFVEVSLNGQPAVVAHARSPGFETYATGWHSVVLQTLKRSG